MCLRTYDDDDEGPRLHFSALTPRSGHQTTTSKQSPLPPTPRQLPDSSFRHLSCDSSSHSKAMIISLPQPSLIHSYILLGQYHTSCTSSSEPYLSSIQRSSNIYLAILASKCLLVMTYTHTGARPPTGQIQPVARHSLSPAAGHSVSQSVSHVTIRPQIDIHIVNVSTHTGQSVQKNTKFYYIESLLRLLSACLHISVPGQAINLANFCQEPPTQILSSIADAAKQKNHPNCLHSRQAKLYMNS